MINKIDYTGKKPAKYTCDRCGKELQKVQRKGIYVTNEKGFPVKKWDLCFKCYKALENGIKKGVKNEQKTTNN